MAIPDDFEGCKAAGELFVQIARAGRPRQPDWQSVAPPWALGSDLRSYHWRSGFVRIWNYLANKNGWPDETKMRLVFPRIKEEGSNHEQGD